MADFYSCQATDPSSLLEMGATELSITYQYEVDTVSESALDEASRRVAAKMLANVAKQAGAGVVRCPRGDEWRRLAGGVVFGDSAINELEGTSNGGKAGGLSSWGHRALRRGGRGSNSIVGLSSGDDSPVDLICHSDAVKTTRLNDDPFNSEEKEVTPGLAGGFVMGGEGDTGDAAEGSETSDNADGPNAETIVASTRIDGKVVSRSVVNDGASSPSPDGPPESGGGSPDYAFNYVSTQSLPLSKSSHSSHNPLVAPKVLRTSSSIMDRPSPSLVSTTLTGSDGRPKVPNKPSTEIIQTRSANKCTVVQGRIAIYTSSKSTFENLEDRLLAALTAEVKNGNIDFEDDIVLGVRMHEEQGTVVTGGDPISTSSGYVTAVKGGLYAQDESSGSGFTASMAVLVTLGCILMAMIALFVKTSNPRPTKRRMLDKESGHLTKDGSGSRSVGTCYEDEVEMDLKALEKVETFDEEDGDYSVDGMYSVSSARESMYSPRRILNSLSFGTPGRKTRASARNVVDDDGEAPATLGENETVARAPDDPSPTKGGIMGGGIMGLFTARPRAASPDGEMELDVQSVYDCDASGYASVKERSPTPAPAEARAAAAAKVAMRTPKNGRRGMPIDVDDDSAYVGPPVDTMKSNVRNHKPLEPVEEPPAAEPEAPGFGAALASYFGFGAAAAVTTAAAAQQSSLPRSSPVHHVTPDGKEIDLRHVSSSAYYGPVDMDAFLEDGNTINRVGTEDPGCMGLACDGQNREPRPKPSSLLRYFTARERCASPHSEVEASLAPFDNVSEYSEDKTPSKKRKDRKSPVVESSYFYGNNGESDRIILNPTMDTFDENDPHAGKRGRFGKRLGRFFNRGRAASPREMDDVDIQEIHQIYSTDNADAEVSGRPSPTPTAIYTMQRKPSSLLRPLGFYKSPSALASRSRSKLGQGSNLEQMDETEVLNTSKEAEEESVRTEAASDVGSQVVAVNGVLCAGMQSITDCMPSVWF